MAVIRIETEKTKQIKQRLQCPALLSRIMTPEEAAELFHDGDVIGLGGFTPSGYPKPTLLALAEKYKTQEAGTQSISQSGPMHLTVYSGASIGSEVEGALAAEGITVRRMPYQTDSTLRNRVNAGKIDYIDMHLSHFAQSLESGALPKVDIAVVEAIAITGAGDIIPTTGIGNAPGLIANADKVIVELNLAKSMKLLGMADIYTPGAWPDRQPIPITSAEDRIGTTYIPCGIEKIAAVVISDSADNTRAFSAVTETERKISENILSFLRGEVAAGRLSNSLLPLQSGVGSVANAVLYGLCDAEFSGLSCYTEVIQDSMLDLLRSGKAKMASCTAVSPSPEQLPHFEEELAFFRDKIILRPQEISNNPEVIRRLGVIAMNTALEADIYGNVNSTHVFGTRMMNGIGGSGDFARNASISIFSTASTAKNGAISSIVPMVSHCDHTEHDVMVLVTEQGYADLRGLSPKERARSIIEHCAHPDYKEALLDYFNRACENPGGGLHTPHLLSEALSWHTNYEKTGTMKR